MIKGQKRGADAGGDNQAKKPKFDKKTAPKRKIVAKDGERKPFIKSEKSGGRPTTFQNKKTGNPFTRNGKPAGKFTKSGDKGAAGANGAVPEVKPEKVDWTKFKQDKKDLKLKRKAAKAGFDKIQEAKQIYEKLKCKATPNKDELCRELHKMFRGGDTYQKLVMAHDTARIVQCMMKRSPAEICQEISQNLIPIVGKLAISEYAHFCVPRLLKYGTAETKHKVIEAMFGNVMTMISRPKSSALVDSVYISYASSQQKALLRQELYGDLYKTSKDKNVKCINDTYKDSPHMKLAVVNAVKSNLEHVANKKLVDSSLVHAVLLDYLGECGEEEKGELVTMFSPYIPSLASTRDGVRAAMLCFWNSIVKDRRAILKTIREHLTKMCTHEHGHVFILALVNSLDDTKALKKSVFDPLLEEVKVIMASEWGRKVLEWFVSPADTACNHPHTIALLEEGLKFSKKDKEVRRAELLEAVDESLCAAIAEDPYYWVRGGHTAITTSNILKNCKNAKVALDGLAEVICNVDWMVATKEALQEEDQEQAKIKKMLEADDDEDEKKDVKPELVSGIEHAGIHIALKKLMKLTKLPASVTEKLTDEVITQWLPLNRPSFLLLNAFENAEAADQETIKQLVKKQVKLLNAQNHAASKLLKQKLAL